MTDVRLTYTPTVAPNTPEHKRRAFRSVRTCGATAVAVLEGKKTKLFNERKVYFH